MDRWPGMFGSRRYVPPQAGQFCGVCGRLPLSCPKGLNGIVVCEACDVVDAWPRKAA